MYNALTYLSIAVYLWLTWVFLFRIHRWGWATFCAGFACYLFVGSPISHYMFGA